MTTTILPSPAALEKRAGRRWDRPGVPHRGWSCADVIDLGSDEGERLTCEMCGKESIRFVHVMEHPDHDGQLAVGCVCAERMANDYVGPRKREAELRNQAARRATWNRRHWIAKANGNHVTKIGKGKYLTVFRTTSGWYGIAFDKRYSRRWFATPDEAKQAAFDFVEGR